MIEFTFFMPWYLFLFIGAFDFGFYNYALISVQNGARSAATVASQSITLATDATTACNYVLDHIRNLPNVGTGTTACTGEPVAVLAVTAAAADGSGATDTRITVTYKTPQLIAIPGVLAGKITIIRTVQMRIVG